MVDGDICSTPALVAELLGVSVQHLARLRSWGEGPPFVKEGGKVYYPMGRLQYWIRLERARLDRL
jgi:Helix-turn-helix domain